MQTWRVTGVAVLLASGIAACGQAGSAGSAVSVGSTTTTGSTTASSTTASSTTTAPTNGTGVAPPFSLPPTTSAAPILPGGTALRLDSAAGWTLQQFHGRTAATFPTTYPPGIALRSSSGVSMRATVESPGDPQPQFFVVPGQYTARGYANCGLKDGLELSVLFNGPEADVRVLVDRLRQAVADVDTKDPFGWLIQFLGGSWRLVGDTRRSSDLFASDSSALLGSGARTVSVGTLTPRRPISNVLAVGLIYNNLDFITLDGVDELYEPGGVGVGGPFAIVLDKSGLVALIEADADPPGFASLAKGLVAVPAPDLASQVGK
jgi:hypothetical protein